MGNGIASTVSKSVLLCGIHLVALRLQSFYHTLIQLSMNMNVDITLINRFTVGCQSVSRAITLTSDDKY